MVENTEKVFDALREFIYEKSGISLNASKDALITARIGKRMRALGLAQYSDYLDYVLKDENGEELVQLLDVISTNVTSFFRESQHFDFLSEKVSEWYRGGQRKFRFWSAACSTGEEPYTIAMTLLESMEKNGCDIRILGTDISTRVLKKSIDGIYDSGKVESIDPGIVRKYFAETETGKMEVIDTLKTMVSFNRINLSKPPFPMKGPFDIVFCRNVMIYFDNEVRKRLLEEIYRLLKPGGYLIVGHSESLTGMLSIFKSIKPSIYIRN